MESDLRACIGNFKQGLLLKNRTREALNLESRAHFLCLLCPTNAKPGSLLQILSMTVFCRKIHPRSSTAAPPSSAGTCLLSNNLFSLCQDLHLSSASLYGNSLRNISSVRDTSLHHPFP
ncbi:hypothetical protein CRENBAI_019067 [Crenichthys baileyi]|uniref:Uncharacterized protein n=1 Tax=Crenichthys baileyi TaxID=28760 RepID=A0AAV9RD07_9TELE